MHTNFAGGRSGDDSRSAVVELLLRSHLADDAYPWVEHDRGWDTWAIDFDALLETATALASEHRAWNLTASDLEVLRIAASLADNAPIQLHALLPSLEYEHGIGHDRRRPPRRLHPRHNHHRHPPRAALINPGHPSRPGPTNSHHETTEPQSDALSRTTDPTHNTAHPSAQISN
ncbi:hypothetical protein MT356_20585 [Rathayibacter festucae]|uniref:hypothetical protein n=1 Tax=Rathayibacter festucae TaxID=110937 RepID=UPI001FB47274|nr:hypothetical protein [Rathayibacter festucae]MCJ1702115.1 hypothetical protein [Rathayibacter festucae]